ncbi:trafficking protein particle complex subunit 4-like [Oppia nitens]|uniref:trafficking protein particle complex subunit 4-like n=1 Tax=Oppia nitens TaxID=1686743 RepID=UPI0023DA9022|nr:trafficking protein particle complex subunit 4-like [Oppia nitens]
MPGIYSVYIISRSGGLIFNYDCEHNFVSSEVEKTFGYPLDIKLDYVHQKLAVTFGQRDGIRVGYALLAINGQPLSGRKMDDKDVMDDILANEENYPINLKFGLPRLTTNEKIVLSSMFHSLYAIAALQICKGSATKSSGGGGGGLGSGKDHHQNNSSKRFMKSSGIEVLETNNFRLNCLQTTTGVKFLIVSDLTVPANKDLLLKKIYELYTDYALKNPFYSLDMPIRCDLFDSNLQSILEQNERQPIINNV